MGRFETISFEGIKTYTLFSKKSFKSVLAIDNQLPMYNFYINGKDIVKEIYLDSPNNLLASAGIILCKVMSASGCYFRVEREDTLTNSQAYSKEKKVFIHPIGPKDMLKDHSLFIIDGITSMFSTKFHIDFENVLKMVVPKLDIETRSTIFKVLSGKGFKADMTLEEVRIKNLFTRKKAEICMLEVEQVSSKALVGEFDEFITKLEKYCKEIIATPDTKYQIAQKMTAIMPSVVKANKK